MGVLSHDVSLVERQTRSIRAQRPLDVAKSVPREDNRGVQTVMSGVGAGKNPLPVTSHQGIDGSLGFRQAEPTRHRPTASPPFDEIPRLQGTCELGTLAATGHVNSRSRALEGVVIASPASSCLQDLTWKRMPTLSSFRASSVEAVLT